MSIDIQEIERYIEAQLKLFRNMPLKSEFNDGVIEGINLVKQFIVVREEQEGHDIAKERGE